MSLVARSVLYIAVASGLRLVREGFVVRALAWPGLLAAGSMVGTALIVGLMGSPVDEVASLAMRAEDAALVQEQIAAAGVELRLDPEPEQAAAQGRAGRAAWREPGVHGEATRWILAAPSAGPTTVQIEAVLRDQAGAVWRIEVPAETPRSAVVAGQSGRMGLIISVLFSLYGVVMGAGLAWRDRSEGVVEAALTLPVPPWTQAAGRVVGLAVVLGLGQLATLLLMHGIMAMDRPIAIAGNGLVSTVVACALGLSAVASPGASDRGFAAPLSRALGLVTALMGLGAGVPELGAWLPVASLGALAVGESPLAAPLSVTLIGLGLVVLAVGRWGRHQGGLGR